MLNGKGNTPNIVCPIHRWTYDLQGKLLGAPHFADQPCVHLGRTPMQNWKGLLFDGPRDVARDLERLTLGDMSTSPAMCSITSRCTSAATTGRRSSRSISRTITSSRFIRASASSSPATTCAGSSADWASVQTVGVNNGLAKAGTRTYERWHKAVLDYTHGQRPAHGAIWLTYYPNIMVEWYPDVLVISTLVPKAMDRTLNVVEYYYPEDIALFEPEFVAAQQAAYRETAREDDEIAERMDAGRNALFAQRRSEVGPYQSPMEDGMQHFHEFYRREMEQHLAGI